MWVIHQDAKLHTQILNSEIYLGYLSQKVEIVGVGILGFGWRTCLQNKG